MAKRWMLLVALFVGCCVANFSVVQAADIDVVIQQFLDNVKQAKDLDDARKEEITTAVKNLAGDPAAKDMAITEGLVLWSNDFNAALEALGTDDLKKARDLLTNLSGNPNPYMSTEATFFLARALVVEEKYEDALPHLVRVVSEGENYTSQMGTVLFFKGMTHAALLETDKAKEDLNNFINNYPTAPERIRVSAWRKLQELNQVTEGSMPDVFQRMDYSRRRLNLENTDKKTQEEQEKIVIMLNKLIEQIEEKECQACKGGKKSGEKPGEGEQQQSQSEGQGQSQSGGSSKNPNGVAKRSFGDGPASPWSNLRDRSRDPAYSVIKEKYPPRYQKLIEQYYKSFQEDKPESGTN